MRETRRRGACRIPIEFGNWLAVGSLDYIMMTFLVGKRISMKCHFVALTTTVDSRRRAQTLARQLVTGRLAACVQTVPIRSVYRWKGAVESAAEYLLIAKTRAVLVKALVGFIRGVHPYEVPEIVVTPITGGLKDYLAWIDAETSDRKPARSKP